MLIDVSNHQGAINWGATAPAIDGAYIKVTEGTGFVDARWRANHDGATSHGKPVGAYHFADLTDPVAEANHFADVYLQATWQLRPVLDIETNGATAAWLKAFRTQFRARTGSAAFRVYSSLSLLTGALNPVGWIDADTDIWVAAYRSVLGWAHPQLALWQSTSSATVPGIVGSVDADQYQNGWSPAVDQGGVDLTPDQSAKLDAIYGQLAGSVTAGQYPGWPIDLGNGKTVNITPVDMLRGLYTAVLGYSQSRIVNADGSQDTNLTTLRDVVFDSAKWEFEDKATLAALGNAVKAVSTGNIDVNALATALTTALGPEVAKAIGEKLVA